MGDHYQTAADLDADSDTAEAISIRLRQWMVSQDIIVPGESDCVLNSSLGHAPGKNYISAVKKPSSHLLELRTNGVEFIKKRTVFHSGESEPTLTCPACGKQSEINAAWSGAVDEWHEGTGPGTLACAGCGAKTAIGEWQYDPPWAFACVGVQFWNWPPLRRDFLKALGEVAGHRFRLVTGKI